MVVLFDWGTYNGLTKLPLAAALGMKLTEIPPYDLARRRDESYFDQYREQARKAFTTITGHAPYYNVVSIDRDIMEKSWRGLIAGARRAKRAGAEIYNLHLGWRAFMDHRDLDYTVEFLRKLTSEVDILVSVEVPYTRRMLGTWEEVRHIREAVGEDKVIVSVQLENAWMLDTGAGDTGRFEEANRLATEDYWMGVLRRTLENTSQFLSLRFSQVVAFAFGRRVLKKRVPLGKGYPDVDPLARALARFMAREVRAKGLGLRMHIIYTGPTETKYHDTINLYATIMTHAVQHLT